MSEIDEGMSKAEEDESKTKYREVQMKDDAGRKVTVFLPEVEPVKGLASWLPQAALSIIQKNFMAMLEAITQNVVVKGHAPSMKFMIDMARRADQLAGVNGMTEESAENKKNFAAFLWNGNESIGSHADE